MPKRNFLEYLQENIVLFDGAMGTEIYARGVYINRCYDELNLSQPALIRSIHRAYIDAGAEVIETNTFGANPVKLAAHGFGHQVVEINRQGAKIARAEAGEEVWVAGSVGPLGIRLEPWGPTSGEEARDAFALQIRALVDGGVDLIVLETFADLREITQALRAARMVCDLPVIALMTITEEGKTPYGHLPQDFGRQLNAEGADVVGLNCGVGPQIMLEGLRKLREVTERPIAILPNAGFPRNVEGRNIYLASAEYMAEYARRFILSGAKIVGGCCGTTPDYIRAMRGAVQSLNPRQRRVQIKVQPKQVPVAATPVALASKSKLGRKLSEHRFILTAEIVPPQGVEVTKCVETARRLQERGVDAINIPEGPRARSRMGAIFLGKIIQDQVGIEPIVHYTCRDRNLLGIISDLLGIHALGMRNLLLITGDPPKMGNLPQATAVFDIDSIGLTNVVHYLNEGVDLSGNPIGKPTEYVIGVGVNPGALDLEYELRRFYWKVKAGAEFAITQPVFDVDLLFNFLQKIADIRIPIIAGVWPLVSLRNAEFMHNEVPGATVPEVIMQRLRACKSKEESVRTGISIACETIATIRPFVEGIQISIPFGNVRYAEQLLDNVVLPKDD